MLAEASELETRARRELKERKRREAENCRLRMELERRNEEMEAEKEEHARELEKLGDALKALRTKKAAAEWEEKERVRREAENSALKMKLGAKNE